jgi:arginase
VLGVPLRTGSLYPGSENDAQAYREAQLFAHLRAAGVAAVDDGDVAIPSYLPHHAVPPIRSWPGPRIAWDCVSERLAPILGQAGAVPLLLGCDCSMVVGSAQALQRAAAGPVHVLYLDGDFDDAAPDAGRCQSAAALAVWLLTRGTPFWGGPAVPPAQVTVMGWTAPSQSPEPAMGSVSLADLRRAGVRETAQRILHAIPPAASILLHLDIDVFRKAELPAAYFPHAEGLGLAEGAELLGVLARDPRVRLVELSEYASLRDGDHASARALVDLLSATLAR